ncbi:unnamed protein product [Dracunculus medinensis]|uniref:Transcription initiation factor TFIID subunit 12 n=1 Tax=Dracunculus medinensis TaxID=318479 RepID=A0A0N4U7S7_DRAME|nr:unnamed protein product [Dracunculus medinensis]
MSDSRPASTPPPNMIALPINMENARNSSEFANMTIGELLGKTKRMQNQSRMVAAHSQNVSKNQPFSSSGFVASQLSIQPTTSNQPFNRSAVSVLFFIYGHIVFRATSGINQTSANALERVRLDDLAQQIDPSSVLEDSVKDILLEFVDNFVEELIERSCKVSRHRGSTILEAKDVEFALKNYYNFPHINRSGGLAAALLSPVNNSQDIASHNADFNAHNQRMAMIRKTIKKP